jgi:hypothetical protein
MAVIKSNGTGGGDFSLTTTWIGGIVPVSGDTAIIQSNDVVVNGGISLISSGISSQDVLDIATEVWDHIINQ